MSDRQQAPGKQLPLAPAGHGHPEGRRCCGRRISEKCGPEEEAAKTNEAGEKSCCKGHHNH